MDRQSSSRSPKFSCMSQLEFSHSSEFCSSCFSSFPAKLLVGEATELLPYLQISPRVLEGQPGNHFQAYGGLLAI